jgi:hypothetical protein
MTVTDAETAREDLAFLRTLLDKGDGRSAFGEGYFAAGLIYGAQMLLHGAQALGWLPPSGLLALVVGLGPTLIFLPVLAWITWRHRSERAATTGRAIGAVFGAVGTANLALVAAIGAVAWREHSLTTWLIYPCAVFILQGAAWLVASVLRRRPWMLAVAGGWMAAGVVMAFCVGSFGAYILVAGLGIWVCMALPGWTIMRLSHGPAAAAAAQ